MNTQLMIEDRGSRYSPAALTLNRGAESWETLVPETPAHTRYNSRAPAAEFGSSTTHSAIFDRLAKAAKGSHLRRWMEKWILTTWTTRPEKGKPLAIHWTNRASLWNPLVVEVSPWIQIRQRIRSFGQLEKGWDTYDAEPPSALAIQNTLEFVRVVEKLCLRTDWVEPTSDDSIMLELKVGDVLQEWDFYSDGDVAVMYEWPNGRDTCHMVKPAVWEMASFLTNRPYATK